MLKKSSIWKRQLHKNYGSNLLETYSYYIEASESNYVIQVTGGIQVYNQRIEYEVVLKDNQNKLNSIDKCIEEEKEKNKVMIKKIDNNEY